MSKCSSKNTFRVLESLISRNVKLLTCPIMQRWHGYIAKVQLTFQQRNNEDLRRVSRIPTINKKMFLKCQVSWRKDITEHPHTRSVNDAQVEEMLSSSLSACSTLRSRDKGALNLGYPWSLSDADTNLVQLSQWVRRLIWRDEQSALGSCSSQTCLLYSRVLESYTLWAPQLRASPLWDLEKSVLQPVIPFSPNFIFSTPNCGEFRGKTQEKILHTLKTVNMKTLVKEMTFQIVQVVWFYGKLWQLSFGPGISEERRVSVLMQSWLVSPEWTSEENAWNQASFCFWWSRVILALRQDWEHRGRCSKFPWLQVNPGDSETPTKQDYMACRHQEETGFVLPKWASFPLPRISCLCYRGI